MFPDQELDGLLASIFKKSLSLFQNLIENPNLIMKSLEKPLVDFGNYFHNFNQALLNNPEQIRELYSAYWHDVSSLIQSAYCADNKALALQFKDSGFKNADWLEHPFFNLLCKHYILINDHVDNLLNNMEYENQNAARKLKFFTKQYLNALSPANFLNTNPEVITEILNTQGRSLFQGLELLLSDLEKNPSQFMVSTGSSEAFKLGKDLARTQGKVIFRNSMIELIQYQATTSTMSAIPLLIIPPWINKYYILDLSANNSLVKWLVDQGITVFMISWINPDARLAHTSLFDYVDQGPRMAIEVIQEQMQVPKVNTLGFCIGGTLLALLLAYNKQHQDNSINSATFLATLMDFSEPGDLSVYIDEENVQRLEQDMQATGFLSGKLMASSFNALRANDLIWSFFIKSYLQGKKPEAFDILFWNADSTNMPATMHSQYLRWMYLENKLIIPGAINLNNTPIHIESIDIPTFFLSTEKDHIAPWKSTYQGYALMKGPKRFLLGGSGHIAGIINSPLTNKYFYKTNDAKHATPEEWLQNALTHQGSWWPEWLNWLKHYSGESIPSLKFNQFKIKALGKAPGTYIFQSCD